MATVNYKNPIVADNKQWRVVIERMPQAFLIKIWLVQLNGSRVYNATVSKDGQLTLTEGKEDDINIPPLMIIPSLAWDTIHKALNDIEPPIKQEIVDAQLQATKYHLEDMRKLVFSEVNNEEQVNN